MIPEPELRLRYPELRLLALFGSRARGDAHGASDWDYGYVADPGFDEDGLRLDLSRSLGTDDIDLVDLTRASGVLRYRAARDGRLVFERDLGEYDRFVLAAVRFWLDVEPVLRASHAALLEQLR